MSGNTTSVGWGMAANFRAIADSLHLHPTRLRELAPTIPTYIGPCDACQQSMGGVWFSTDAPPVLWRQPFPRMVQRELVTSNHPTGTLSISDCEVAASIAHKDVLASNRPVADHTLWTASDNRATVAWTTKGSATSNAVRAYLLRLNALHQRQHCYIATQQHIAGTANVMADNASRLWNLDNDHLLSHFASHYPQGSPWQLRTLPHDTNLATTRQCRPQLASLHLRLAQRPHPNPAGICSAVAYRHPHTRPLTRSLCQWKKPSAPWGRRTQGWGPPALA